VSTSSRWKIIHQRRDAARPAQGQRPPYGPAGRYGVRDEGERLRDVGAVLAQGPLLTSSVGDEHKDAFRQHRGFQEIDVDDIEFFVDPFMDDRDGGAVGFLGHLRRYPFCD